MIIIKIVDLHTHSNISDGSLSPEELIHRDIDLSISAIALTDHDTIDGISRAKAAAKEQIEFIPGIELSAFYKDREVHIVGLYINIENEAFYDSISKVALVRDQRNLLMIKNMADHGIDITPEKMFESEGSGILTRANFANYLKNHGYVSSTNEAFKKYLDKGRPFYIPRQQLSPKDAIHMIQLAGGVPILAHPLLYKFTMEQLRQCLRDLKELGLVGMEAYYSRNTGTDTPRMKTLADEFGLIYSGGSDFHGKYKPDIELGIGTGHLRVPYEVLDGIKNARP